MNDYITKSGLKKFKKYFAWFKKTIKPKQFQFESFVSATDKKGCGTVCCFAGWLPRYDNHWKWRKGEDLVYVKNQICSEIYIELTKDSTESNLSHYFEMDSDLVDHFFFSIGNLDYDLGLLDDERNPLDWGDSENNLEDFIKYVEQSIKALEKLK